MRIAYLGDPSNNHVRRWVEHFARKHTCALFCDPPVMRPIQGVEIICPPMSTLRKAVAFKMIRHPYSNNYFKASTYRNYLSHWRPDLVHGFEALAFGYATARCNRFPTVLTPFGNDIFDWPRQSVIARYLVKRALRGVDAISTNAPGLETYLQEEYGVDPARVDCFSWGADLEIFQPGLVDEARVFGKRFAIPDDAQVVLSPRKMKPYWGIELIAEAVPEIIRRMGGKIVFVFLRSSGDADFEAQLRQRLEDQGYAANVRFVTERLTPDEMAAAFNRANAFISVPKTDLLSCTVMEGVACGCAAVLADLPYYHSRVQEGIDGFYVSEYNAEALADAVQKALSADLGKNAVNAEETRLQDDWNISVAKMEALYKRTFRIQ